MTPRAKRKHLARIAPLGGSAAAESGQIAALGRIYGPINGSKIKENGGPEHVKR